MRSQRPKTAEQYVGMVEQAITEIQELRACIDYDVEDDAQRLGFLDPLERELGKLRESMRDGSYYFNNEDLDFMILVRRNLRHIPFADLLATINQTHREGLNIDSE